jgi:hypothetical protein
MSGDSGRHDRVLGIACLVLCPALTGLFLGLVAIVCAYPNNGGHAVALGTAVAVVAFAVNALAICVTATALHLQATRRDRQAVRV